VECETPYAKGGRTWAGTLFVGLVWLLCGGWLGVLLWFASNKPREMVGRELVLRLPLRISAEAQPEVRRLGNGTLRQLLCTVPLYARLLGEYPKARVYIGR
jgi:hypothetical protein